MTPDGKFDYEVEFKEGKVETRTLYYDEEKQQMKSKI